MQRDLACLDPWEDSLQRSRARRAAARQGGRREPAINEPALSAPLPVKRPAVYRDLTDAELWAQSRRRAHQRHELAAARGPELPARELSVAALLAIASVPVAGATVAQALSGGGGSAGAGTATVALVEKSEPAAESVAVAAPAPKQERSEPAAAPAQPKPSPKPAAPPTTRVAAEESGGATAATAQTTTTAKIATVSSTRSAKRPGGGVADLQRALGIGTDGDFGRKTEAALKRWQRAHGLKADGVVGAETRTALKLGSGPALKRERPARTHRKRAHRRAHARPAPRRGGGVGALQRALGIPADGVFGPATERALKRWQRRHGLTADGVAGPQTRAKLGIGSGPVLKRKRGGRHHRGGGGGSGGSGRVAQVIAAANRIAGTPYKYGGGHGSWSDSGYDCSGSLSYALHGAGLLSSPLDSVGFMSYGSPGRGRHITIYANNGHAFMVIDGRRFDTSARSQTGSRWSGSMRSTSGFVARHPAGL